MDGWVLRALSGLVTFCLLFIRWQRSNSGEGPSVFSAQHKCQPFPSQKSTKVGSKLLLPQRGGHDAKEDLKQTAAVPSCSYLAFRSLMQLLMHVPSHALCFDSSCGENLIISFLKPLWENSKKKLSEGTRRRSLAGGRVLTSGGGQSLP